MKEFWLLKEILKLALPAVSWPGIPQSVLPEFSVESERPDIVIDWGGFRLIIEYKVDASEGEDQIKRYLKSFGINGPADGAVIYLTPTGNWPIIRRECVLPSYAI